MWKSFKYESKGTIYRAYQDADGTATRFNNYRFEIQLSDEITYTYRLSEGVARNQNATYLLKNILKTTLE